MDCLVVDGKVLRVVVFVAVLMAWDVVSERCDDVPFRAMDCLVVDGKVLRVVVFVTVLIAWDVVSERCDDVSLTRRATARDAVVIFLPPSPAWRRCCGHTFPAVHGVGTAA